MATMKSIRQVKTVFVIFIAFVCCWSPYIVVLLCDNSDSLPLPVHIYASMLAHLHASLNFAIYGLSNRAHYRRYVSRICCVRQTMTLNDGASNVLYFASEERRTYAGGRECVGRVLSGVNRVNRVNVEYHRTSESEGCRVTSNASWRPLSVSTEDEHVE